jgi:hypothetical protein
MNSLMISATLAIFYRWGTASLSLQL